jgi:predicted SAM-dependent methyltransferase
VAWGSFGYFDEGGNAAFLKAVFRTLKPGGRFVIETHIAETLLRVLQERDWRQVGNTLVLEDRHYDHVHSRIDTEWTLMREGKAEKISSSIRIYTYRELCRLLEEVGFTNCEGYDTSSQQPFTLGAQRLTMVATKPVNGSTLE